MSEKYRFFDSIDGEDERYYTADEFAEYFRQFISNGIFNGGDNLRVTTSETDMNVSISEGYAWLEGYLYKIDTEALILTLDSADPSLNRIDRIVIRLDKTLDNRYVKAFILKGTPAEEPQAPEITRNENIYEISLAQINVLAGKSFIEGYQIVDERLNNEVCGLVTHLFEQVDTTEIFNQFQAWLNTKTSEPDGEFYKEWKKWFSEVQHETNLVTKADFDIHENDYLEFKSSTNMSLEEIYKNIDNYSSYMSDEDNNGIFRIVEYKRLDGSLYMKSTLSNPNAKGSYQTNIWDFYDDAGLNIINSITWLISYDKNNRMISKVVSV